MMRLTRLFFLSAFVSTVFIGCDKDEEEEVIEVPLRDLAEQSLEDDETLQAYLQTHFYNEEDFVNPNDSFDYVVRFDTIAGENSEKTPLIDSPLLSSKVVKKGDIEYKVYILKIREGAGEKPTFADSVYVKYKGELTNRNMFDNAVTPVWFDLSGYIVRNSRNQLVQAEGTGIVAGFAEGISEFREASGYEVNPDNTISWNNDFGVGAFFFPSGLGYFANSQPGIPVYSPLIFSINLMRTVEADHDNDGIPSIMEDLNNDSYLFNDDTDGNGFPNNSDADDDGDGTLTIDEIIINEDGEIEFPDTNGNGIPNYLDPDDFVKVE